MGRGNLRREEESKEVVRSVFVCSICPFFLKKNSTAGSNFKTESRESAQNRYVENLQTSIDNIIKESSGPDPFSKFRSVYGVRKEAVSSRPPGRDGKRKSEAPVSVITLDDSDEEIQEIDCFPKFSRKEHENDMSIKLVKKQDVRLPEIVLESDDEAGEEPYLIPTLGESTLSQENIVDLSAEEESDDGQTQGSLILRTPDEHINEDEDGLEAAIQSEEQEKEDHVDEEIAVQRSRERVSAGAEAMVAETEVKGS